MDVPAVYTMNFTTSMSNYSSTALHIQVRNMRPLVIDPASKERVAALKTYARKHLYGRAIIEKMEAGLATPPAYLNDNFRILFDVGFSVIYTIEEHTGGWFHHLSITLDTYNKMAHPVMVQEIMNEFAFDRALADCYVFQTPNVNPPTVNVVEPLPGGSPDGPPESSIAEDPCRK